METLATIASRASAGRLVDPGPTDEQLQGILEAASRAPDHGRLSPWRFTIVEGDARATLGRAFEEARRRADPGIAAAELQREFDKAFRAPTIVVVGAKLQLNGRIPAIEQIAAVAAAVQNMFLVAHDLGLGAMWKTGVAAYDAEVKRLFGLSESDAIVAFLYLGTAERLPPPRKAELAALVRRL